MGLSVVFWQAWSTLQASLPRYDALENKLVTGQYRKVVKSIWDMQLSTTHGSERTTYGVPLFSKNMSAVTFSLPSCSFNASCASIHLIYVEGSKYNSRLIIRTNRRLSWIPIWKEMRVSLPGFRNRICDTVQSLYTKWSSVLRNWGVFRGWPFSEQAINQTLFRDGATCYSWWGISIIWTIIRIP